MRSAPSAAAETQFIIIHVTTPIRPKNPTTARAKAALNKAHLMIQRPNGPGGMPRPPTLRFSSGLGLGASAGSAEFTRQNRAGSVRPLAIGALCADISSARAPMPRRSKA
jgi:hypothetical protein